MIRFLPSVLHHKACGKHCSPYFPETFTLLCWNVHKKNQTDPAFRTFLKKLLKKKDLYLCMFQEAEFRGDAFTIEDCAYDAAANLQVKDTFYGVLTACKTESLSAKAYLSDSQESLVGRIKVCFSAPTLSQRTKHFWYSMFMPSISGKTAVMKRNLSSLPRK